MGLIEPCLPILLLIFIIWVWVKCFGWIFTIPQGIREKKEEDMRIYNLQQQISRMKSEGDVEGLTSLLSDKAMKVQEEAAMTLAEMGAEKAIVPIMKALPLSRYQGRPYNPVALMIVNSSRKKILKELVRVLDEEDDYLREWASSLCSTLVKKEDKWIATKLIDVLNKREAASNTPACDFIVEALGKIGDKRAVKSLVDLLEKSSSFRRRYENSNHWYEPLAIEVARALSKMESEEAVKPLLEALDRGDSEFKKEAKKTLDKYVNRMSKEELKQYLYSK